MALRPKAAGNSFLMFLGLPFILAGLGVGIFYGGMLWDWYQARAWVEVPCILESSTLRDHMERQSSGSTRDTLMNEAVASYRYTYMNRQYQGDRVSFSLGADNFGDFQERVSNVLMEARNAGGAFRCFVSGVRPEESVLFREARWTLLLFTSVFPLLFPLVGANFFWTGLKGRRERARLHGLQGRYPGQPWRWKPEWAGDWILPKNRPSPWAWTAVTGWMFLVWGPMLYALMVDSDVTRANPVSLIGFLPVIPLGVCSVLTLRAWWRHRQPVPQVHVEPLPILTGGPLFAEVALPLKARLPPLQGMLEAQLSCHQESTVWDHRKNTSTQRELRWKDTQSVQMLSAIHEEGGCRVTVAFDIPASIPAEDQQRIGTEEFDFVSWVWELELERDGQKWCYDMPVYVPHQPLAAESPEAQAAAQVQREVQEAESAAFRLWQMQNLDADELQMHLAKRYIDFTFESRSKMPLSFDLPLRRFAQARALPIFFTLIWVCIAVGMARSDLPLIFPLLWGGTSLLLVWLLTGLFKSRTLRLDDQVMKIGWKLGPYGKSLRVHREEMVRFRVSNAGLRVNGEHYAAVYLVRQGGDKIVILDGLPGERVAESLVLLLEQWRKQA